MKYKEEDDKRKEREELRKDPGNGLLLQQVLTLPGVCSFSSFTTFTTMGPGGYSGVPRLLSRVNEERKTHHRCVSSREWDAR